MDDLEGLRQYEGIASCGGTLYRVRVLTQSQWKADAVKAVRAAKGFLQSDLIETPVDSPGASKCAGTKAAYEVSFTPDPRITQGYASKKGRTVYLRSDRSPVHDGDLQRPPRSVRSPTPLLYPATRQSAGRHNTGPRRQSP